MKIYRTIIFISCILLSGCVTTQVTQNIPQQKNISMTSRDVLVARPYTEIKQLPDNGRPTSMSLQRTNLSFVGDLMLGSRVKDAIDQHGCDWSFSGTQEALASSDAIIVNLETPVTTGTSRFNKKRTFRADPAHLACLSQRHPRVIANLANNHIGDYGADGVNDTIHHLKSHSINYFGAGLNQKEAYNIYSSTIGDHHIAFIGQTCVQPPAFEATESKAGNAQRDEEQLLKAIQQAHRRQADIIIFNGHCGKEYVDSPTQKQTDMYHFAIDHGVDLVIGHHPHRYQGVELYSGSAIFYSLGNFVSDIFRGRRTQEGIIVTIRIENKKITQADLIPVRIEGFGNTTLMSEQNKKRVREELYKLSTAFQDTPSLISGYIKLE